MVGIKFHIYLFHIEYSIRTNAILVTNAIPWEQNGGGGNTYASIFRF